MLRRILAVVGLLMLLWVAGLGARFILEALSAPSAPAPAASQEPRP